MNALELQSDKRSRLTRAHLVRALRPLVFAIGVGGLLLGLWLTPRSGTPGTVIGSHTAPMIEQRAGAEESCGPGGAPEVFKRVLALASR
jgi:hypothetical protein